MKRWNCILSLALLTCLLTVANAGKPDKPGGGGKGDTGSSAYTMVVLDNGPGYANGINQDGEIVGYLTDVNGDIPCHWTISEAGAVTVKELPLGDYTWGRANDINNAGIIVGEGRFWLNKSSIPISLPVPLGAGRVRAKGINDSGDICGTVQFAGSNAEAFLLMQLEEGLVEVPLLEQDNRRQDTQNTDARALNNATVPQILGKRDVLDLRGGGYHEWDAPVLWQGDQAINLEETVRFYLSAEAINDNGWIVGQGYSLDGVLFPIVMIP